MTTALERSRALPPDPTMPTLQEELNRKALDAVEFLLYRYQDGTITANELQVATGALFDTVAGLVDPGIIDIISETAKLRVEGKPVVIRKFVKDNKLALIERSLADASVQLSIYETAPGFVQKTYKFNEEMRPHQMAQGRFDGLSSSLVADKGFEEIR